MIVRCIVALRWFAFALTSGQLSVAAEDSFYDTRIAGLIQERGFLHLGRCGRILTMQIRLAKPMRLGFQKIISIAMLAIYIIAGPAVEVTHHHTAVVKTGTLCYVPDRSFALADGASPPQVGDQCSLCFLIAQRNCTQPYRLPDHSPSPAVFTIPPVVGVENVQPIDIQYCGKRGPPLV
jgi:hypothetical protein